MAKLFGAVRVALATDRPRSGTGVDPPPAVWDEVEVPEATSLDVVAEAAGVEEDEVVALNPHILRKVTPRGRGTTLRLPRGRGDGFEKAYTRMSRVGGTRGSASTVK